MSTAIGIIVALVLVAVVVWLVVRSRSAKRLERRRVEAEEHRRLAGASQLEAERMAAEADARAARAKQEQVAAEEQRLQAVQARSQARDLHARADELDPDVEPADGADRADNVDR